MNKVVLKIFAKFIGKHLFQSFFFNKVGPQLYQKRDSDTGVFLRTLQNFQEQLFYKTLSGDCFCKSMFSGRLCNVQFVA